MNAALLSSKNMCWCTPQDFFDKLNAEFGFVLDPAATDKTAKCSLYYTPETDGLSQSWDRGGAVFWNPPYGREIGKWVQKAFEEAGDLEDVYRIFNTECPWDFKGHSLSVSDVVEVVEGPGMAPGFYFCDCIGFQRVEFNPALASNPGAPERCRPWAAWLERRMRHVV